MEARRGGSGDFLRFSRDALLRRGPRHVTYSYDPAGNQTASSAGLALAYNSLNQASSMTNPTGGTVTAMTYAGIGNAQRTAAGTTTSTNNSFGIASTTTSGATIYFTRDPSGNLNSMVSGGSRYYYLYDGQGNVIGLINSTGGRVATNGYDHDPYGTVTSSGTLATTNPYRYAAGYQDPTGYTKFGARYYNPTLGAWTQLDPSGQNPGYTYAGGDPINESDATGLQGGSTCSNGLATAAQKAAYGCGYGSIISPLESAASCLGSALNPTEPETSPGGELVGAGASAGALSQGIYGCRNGGRRRRYGCYRGWTCVIAAGVAAFGLYEIAQDC